MKLYKYEFKSKLAFTKQLNKIKVEIDENNFVYENVKALIPLGFIQIGIDEEENPILSESYCVDIVWRNDREAENFTSYKVEPKNPKHKILGW